MPYNLVKAGLRQIHYGGADSTLVELLGMRKVVEDAVELRPQRGELVGMQAARLAADVRAGERERAHDFRHAAHEFGTRYPNTDAIDAGIESGIQGGRAPQDHGVRSRQQRLQTQTWRQLVDDSPRRHVRHVAQADRQRLSLVAPLDLVQSLNGRRVGREGGQSVDSVRWHSDHLTLLQQHRRDGDALVATAKPVFLFRWDQF